MLTGARISEQEQGWLEFLAKLRYTEAFWPGGSMGSRFVRKHLRSREVDALMDEIGEGDPNMQTYASDKFTIFNIVTELRNMEE